MSDSSDQQLIINYLLGICTDREVRDVEKWLQEDPRNVQLLQKLAKNLKKDSPLSSFDKQEMGKNIINKINAKTSEDDLIISSTYGLHIMEERQQSSLSMDSPSVFWLRSTAIFVIILLAGVAGYYSYQPVQFQKKKIWKTRTLPNGQTATFRFSDGSIINVNGGSTIRYQPEFDQNLREVYLQGEAFFSVQKNKSRPFVVHTKNISTRVLGTSFNIKAYEDEPQVQVAVQEGTVSVTENNIDHPSQADSGRVILKKNQWLSYHADRNIVETGQGDIWDMIAWKDHVLIFNNKSFSEVARMLERWYGVRVVIEDEILKTVVLQGEHEDVSLKKVLDSIKFALGINYTIKGDLVTIQSA